MAIKGNRDHSQVDKMLVSKGQFFFLQSDVNYKVVDKHFFEMKMTKLGVGHFTSIAGQFFANYINSFHKTEVQKFPILLSKKTTKRGEGVKNCQF